MLKIHTPIQTIFCYPASMWKKYLQGMLHYLSKEKNLDFTHSHLELIVTHDHAMSVYNTQHMHVVGPTNILSFPTNILRFSTITDSLLSCTDKSTCHTTNKLGTLVLSVDTLEREAKLYGQNPTQYAIRLLAHGMAHLLGYDHSHDMDVLCQELEAITPNHSPYSFTPFWSFNHG